METGMGRIINFLLLILSNLRVVIFFHCKMYLKTILKTVIPFLREYCKSLGSNIHNQTYLGYVSFCVLGSCRGGGGIILFIKHAP